MSETLPIGLGWVHCSKHNVDYPSADGCPKCKQEKPIDVQDQAKILALAVQQVLENAKQSEWASVNQPFTQQLEQKKSKNVIKPNDSAIKAEIAVFQSKTFLDQFFLDKDDKSLGGIPKVAQIGIVGNPDVGKSLLVEEIALRLASEGHKTVFCTTEDIWQSDNERFDLQSRCKQKVEILGLNWENIKANLYILDTISHSSLRDWQTLISTYRQLVEQEEIEYLVLDSLTLLENYRAGLKFHLGEFVRYNQLHNVTGFYVSQKATEDAIDEFGFAGSIGLGHLFDVVFNINFKKVSSWDGQMKADCDARQGEILHFIRLLKCRLTRTDMRYHRMVITSDGFLRLIPKTVIPKTVNGDQTTIK